jgi:hypothetical protein
MAERIPPLTPRQSKQLQRHEETKRLAEMAWAVMMAPDNQSNEICIAHAAWDAAEIMYAESERRRPVE